MASKLNPGADATLVNVAYRAAMADTPADYSGTLEKAAESYGKTMEASSEMWGNVAEVGAKLGSEMVKNANERAAMSAKASTLNPEDAEFLISEIYGNKDAQKDLGLLPGVFGDRQTKMDLAKLKMEQQELFAEIDLAAASIKTGTDAVAAGTFDTKLSMDGGEMVNAIIKSGLKNTVTDNQNVAKLGRNEFGELTYTLYNTENNPDGEVLMGTDNKPRTMTVKQFNEAIATNVDDKGAKAAIFDTYNNQVADRGLESRTGVYDEQMRAMDSNWLDTQLEKPVDLKRAMNMKFGYMQTSFFDDITKNQNQYSAELYADLLKATGGDALTGGIVDGIEDVGEPGINEVELKNSKNYQVLTANLLGMKDPEVTKAYFKDYVLKEFEGANDYGHGNKAPKPGSGTDGTKTGTNPYGLSLSKKGKYGLGLPSKGTSYVPQYDTAYVTNKIDNLKSGSRIDFQGDNYTFREVDGVTQWWKNYGYGDDYGKKVEGVGIGTPIGTAKDMAEDVFYVGDDPIFNSIVTEREQEVPDDKTGLLPSDNQFADRQSVAEGQGQAAVVPADFVDVFKKDFQSDLEVVKYLKNMNVPGLVVGTYQGNPDYNYPNNDNKKLVKASDTAYDDVVLTLNGKTKLFTTDPSFSDDTEGAQEIWNWLHENFSGNNNKVEW